MYVISRMNLNPSFVCKVSDTNVTLAESQATHSATYALTVPIACRYQQGLAVEPCGLRMEPSAQDSQITCAKPLQHIGVSNDVLFTCPFVVESNRWNKPKRLGLVGVFRSASDRRQIRVDVKVRNSWSDNVPRNIWNQMVVPSVQVS